jgi:hypothetical protein
MLLTSLIEGIRIELQDLTEAVYDDEELIRGIYKSVSLMSRFIPKRTFIAGTVTAPMIISDHILDINSILPPTGLIKIERIEYPIDQTPVTYPTFDTIDRYIMFRSDLSMAVGDQFRIFYLKPWTPPTSLIIGDYPEHLDDALIIGASGQVLIFKAQKYTQEALTVVTDSITTLKAIVSITPITAPTITTGLLDTADAELDLASTAFHDAQDATADGIDTIVPYAVTDVGLARGYAVLGSGYLATGSALANIATRGDRPAAVYADYGAAEAAIASAIERCASAWASVLGSYVNAGSQYNAAGMGHVNAAAQWVAIVGELLKKYGLQLEGNNQLLQQQARTIDIAGKLETHAKQYLEIAGRYLASGQAKINEFLASMGVKPEFSTTRASSEQRS